LIYRVRNIKKTILFFLLFLFALVLKAQEPKIGSEKGIKEKLMRIKKALPDLKKNLTKRDENFPDDYVVKMEMGNGIVLFREDAEEKTQSITIRYTPSYFSGSVTDYQSYYKTLSGLIKEVFGSRYISNASEMKNSWETNFYLPGKDRSRPTVSIMLSCSWVLGLLNITIDIYSYL